MSDNVCTVETCDHPAGDGFVCRGCISTLEQVLAETPWLVDDLNLVITKQVRYTSGGGRTSGSAEVPLPFNLRASDVLSDLVLKLASWCALLAEENPHWAMPNGHPRHTSAWLLCRLETIRCHEAGNELVEEVCRARAAAMFTIDRPQERQFLGECGAEYGSDAPGSLETDAWGHSGYRCQRPLFGRSGEHTAACEDCGAEWEVAVRRRWVESRALEGLADRLFTATEAASVLAAYGHTDDEGRLADRIRKWATPRKRHDGADAPARLTARAHVKRADQRRRPAYRLGDIQKLADEGIRHARQRVAQ